jgi:1-acyl-sn-glycerol-3-phosphate acyltransferase
MKRALARLLLWLGGWSIHGTKPEPAKYVVIAAPHTTNWDFIWVLAFAWALDIDMKWLGKHTLFRWPMGPIMRWLGGIPVRRHERANLVDQLAARFEQEDAFVVVVPAEGTRGWVPKWRSGFYHLARAARVPVGTGFLDYHNKVGGFGPMLHLTGDVRLDMDRIRAFYDPAWGKYPDQSGVIRLSEEEAEEPTVA